MMKRRIKKSMEKILKGDHQEDKKNNNKYMH
jgi:hypothetical protein